MTLLVSDAIAHVRHTLASSDVPSIGAYRILDDAGEHLVNMHSWVWLEDGQATLDLTQNQAYVWLPDDFREIVAVQLDNGLNAGIRLTSKDRVLELRALATAPSFEYHAAVANVPRGAAAGGTLTVSNVGTGHTVTISDAYNPSTTFTFRTTIGASDDNTATQRYVALGSTDAATASALAIAINDAPGLYVRATVANNVVTLTHQRLGTRGNSMTIAETGGNITVALDDTGVDDGPVRPRLELWPTPSDNDNNRILVYYRRGWQSCENDNALIPIPSWCETLYLTMVRAIARGYERESEADISQRILAVQQGPLAKAAIERDKLSVPHIGAMRGGAASCVRVGYNHMWNFNSVAGPS
jgi:hypothetical protein